MTDGGFVCVLQYLEEEEIIFSLNKNKIKIHLWRLLPL